MTENRILRLTLGINILLHGAVRLPALGAFAEGMVQQFADTPLPAVAVHLFGLSLPVLETAIGLLLIIGLSLRKLSHMRHSGNEVTLLSLCPPMVNLGLIIVPTGDTDWEDEAGEDACLDRRVKSVLVQRGKTYETTRF